MKKTVSILMTIALLLCTFAPVLSVYASEPVTGMTIDTSAATLVIGSGVSQKLTETIIPASATDTSVIWTAVNQLPLLASSTPIVNVSSTGQISVASGATSGTCLITVTSNSNPLVFKTCLVKVNYATPVTGVTVTPTTETLVVGHTLKLTSVVAPTTATNNDVEWTSANVPAAPTTPVVASVSATGLITALNPGTAKITVTTVDGNFVAACTVTVAAYVPVTSVLVTPSAQVLDIGDTFKLTSTVAPANATNKVIKWSSSDDSIAIVNEDTGLVMARSQGKVTITATSNKDDGYKSDTCMVTVEIGVPVKSVTINPSTASIMVGDTKQLTATVSPATASNKDVSWSTSNSTVATVSSTGLVTAKAEGTATITVTTENGNKTDTCTVTVTKAINVTGVSVSPTSATLAAGETKQLTATISPAEATNKSFKWTSSKSDVADVSSTGLITAKSEGSATITVTTDDGSKTATCTVTVTKAVTNITGVSVSPTAASLVTGETKQLTATVLPAEAPNKSVTWFSSNEAVATVSASGIITAKSVGKATITVTAEIGSKSATCEILVSKPSVSVTGVIVNKTVASIVSGKTIQLTATVLPSNASNKSVTWTSSNANAATVSSSGLVTAKAAGKTIITCTSNDSGGYHAACLLTVIPQTPGSAKAVSASFNSIKISWSAVSGATGYVVYRYDSKKYAFSKIKVTKSTSITDTSRITGSEYYYKVRAYTTVNGVNIYGNPSSVGFKGTAVPQTPGNVTASRVSSKSIKIRWDVVSGATGYVVYRYFTATKTYDRIKVTNGTSFTNTNLKKGVNYYFKVRAYRTVNGIMVFGNPSERVVAKTY